VTGLVPADHVRVGDTIHLYGTVDNIRTLHKLGDPLPFGYLFRTDRGVAWYDHTETVPLEPPANARSHIRNAAPVRRRH
jgi:hypothetical protein